MNKCNLQQLYNHLLSLQLRYSYSVHSSVMPMCADLHMFMTGSEVVYFFLTGNINLLPFVLGYAENAQRLSGL